MTSERQKKANQANARRSTGPMTPEGKRAVRLNGVRHGLLARDIVLPGEDEGDFERLRCAVHADFSPSGPVEAFLVDRVVNTLWRLRRVEKVETALLYWRVSALRIEQLAAEVRSHERSTLVAGYEMPLLGPQYEITITNGAAHAAAEQRLANACKERDRAVSALGHVIDADLANEEGLSKLSRYETTIERYFYRSLHELQRLQAARQGRPGEVPHAVDLDVSNSPGP
jgi:hypothetical protein